MKENSTMNVTGAANTANTANAKTGSMDIKVTVTPMQNQEGCLKANASILFNNVFKVTGIRIGISQKGNVFVSMPDYKTGKLDDTGKDIYQDIAYPVTRQFRQELYDEVVKEFHAVMRQETPQVGEE
jgi:DNA-binding cell septation regulator SpoVG